MSDEERKEPDTGADPTRGGAPHEEFASPGGGAAPPEPEETSPEGDAAADDVAETARTAREVVEAESAEEELPEGEGSGPDDAPAPSGLDALDEGPRPSDPGEEAPELPEADPDAHPTVRALLDTFEDAVVRHETVSGDQHVVYLDPERNREILRWLHDEPEHAYKLLVDVTGVDLGDGAPLQVVYQLYSIEHKERLRVKCLLPLDALEIDSVVPIWAAANWLEREVYDMFGISFRDHPDPRRILMPEDYAEGHPLRKDFPLRGRLSRAEQTRRALAQDVDRFYIPSERAIGREPQEVHFPDPNAPESPEAGAGVDA